MKPEVAVFTKDEPCTKRHIWNCFRGKRGFRKVVVPDAHAIIGVNAPKNMLKRGYVCILTQGNKESYELTEAGKEWLTKGIAGYIKRHPEDVKRVENLPKSLAA
jgi:hypothetical protein